MKTKRKKPTELDRMMQVKSIGIWIQAAQTYRDKGKRKEMRRAAMLYRTELAKSVGRSIDRFVDDPSWKA